jgi:hypothetical protein
LQVVGFAVGGADGDQAAAGGQPLLVHPGVLHGHPRGGDGELAGPAKLVHIQPANPLPGIEIVDLAAVGEREPGRIEHRDRPHPTAPRPQPSRERRRTDPDARDDPKTGQHHPLGRIHRRFPTSPRLRR